MILFVVRRPRPRVASARYRAYLPALYLNRAGAAARVVSGRLSKEDLAGVRAIVFAKAFQDHDLKSCILAHRLRIPIFIDLCDNIFVPSYGAGRKTEVFARNFMAMAAMASGVTTATDALAAIIRPYVPAAIHIHTVPDMAETRGDVEELSRAPARVVATRQSWLDRILTIVRTGRGKPAPAPTLAATVHDDPVPDDLPRVLWFGNHGFEHSSAGMLSILSIAPALIEAFAAHPFRLVIVSNNRQKFENHIAPLPIPTSYREWSALGIYDELAAARVCLLPNPKDPFSLPKSNNRAILALANGVPVISSDFPAMAALKPCVAVENWRDSLLAYLADPARARRDVLGAQEIIARDYSGAAVAARWRELIDTAPTDAAAGSTDDAAKFWLHIERPEDAARLLPAARALSATGSRVQITVRSALVASHPSTVALTEEMGFATYYLHPAELVDGYLDALFAGQAALVLRIADGNEIAARLRDAGRQRGIPVIDLDEKAPSLARPELARLAAALAQTQTAAAKAD